MAGSQPERRIGLSEEHEPRRPTPPIFQLSRIPGGSWDVLAVTIPGLFQGVYCKDTQEGEGNMPRKVLPSHVVRTPGELGCPSGGTWPIPLAIPKSPAWIPPFLHLCCYSTTPAPSACPTPHSQSLSSASDWLRDLSSNMEPSLGQTRHAEPPHWLLASRPAFKWQFGMNF